MSRTLPIVCIALSLVVCAASAAVPGPESIKRVVTDPAHQYPPGCVVGVFRDGAVQTMVADGFADIGARRPLDGDTVFYAASVSKQFTALAVAQLVGAGRLALDDDVRKYLPELPQYSRVVTVDMLLHHTSGIRDWIDLMEVAGLDPAAEDGMQTALRTLFRQKGTNFTPGTEFGYSNGGYLLLAEIVARVSGQPFAEYAKANILVPLGMTGSQFLNGMDPNPKNLAHGYAVRDGGFVIRDNYPHFSGSGGLMTTMHDLARYEHDIAVDHKVWTPVVARIMLTPGKFADGTPVLYQPGGVMGYASGLAVGLRKGQYFVQHDGVQDGFRNEYARLPKVGLSVVLLCNRGDWDPQEKADAIIELVQAGLLVEPSPQRLQGTYYSSELAAHYVLRPEGTGIHVTVVPDAGGPGTSFVLAKARDRGYESAYANDALQLTPDADDRGFVLRAGRAQGLHLQRVAAGQ